MRKAEIYPICNVDPSFDYSLLTVGDTTASNRNILLQRIELLELENMELRKRQEYLKMINATLLEALGNKQTLRDMINKLPNNSFAAEKNQKNDTNHTNKMTSFKKKAKQKKLELSQAQRRSIETVYEADLDPNSSFRRFDVLNEEQLSSSREKPFSRTRPSGFYDKKQIHDVFKNRSSTPKVQTRIASNYNTHIRKSVNSLMQPLQSHNYFSKRDLYLSCSAQSQKSPASNVSQSFNKNIATALLCDLCGLSYSPFEFMAHARQCQANHYEEQYKLNKITDKSFQEDQSDSGSEGLLQTLEQQKAALLKQINKLKRNRSSPDKRLQRNLDQIVFIINNKKSLNQKDIKTLLKEKNCCTTSTSRRR